LSVMISETRRSMKFVCLLSVLVFSLAGACEAEALSVRALVDRNRISEQESIELRIVMTDGEGEVDVSVIKDFNVAFRGRSSSVRIVNTQMTREIHLLYALTPLRSGSLVIPSLEVRSGNEVVRTESVTVEVNRQAAARTGGGGDLLMLASVSEARPWVGQEIAYTFRLLAGVKVYSARYQRPSFEGFTVKDLDGQKEYSTVLNGRQYSVTEVTYLLTPIRANSLMIEPGVLTCEVADVSRQARPRSPFGSLFDDPFFSGRRTVARSVRSESIPVTAKALPEYKGKRPFSGLVGSFSLAASLEGKEVRVGDSVTLTLTVEGRGNVPDAPEPEFRRPDGVKIYPDNPEESVTHDTTGTNGRKLFRFAIIPVEEGLVTLGPFAYTVFDSKAGEYRELETGAVTLRVQPPLGGMATAVPSPGQSAGESRFRPKRRVLRTGQDILSIHRDLDVLKRSPQIALPFFTVGILFPPLMYFTFLGFSRARQKTVSARVQMAARARSLLNDARAAEKSGSVQDATSLLHRALVSTVFAAAGRTGESLTYDETRALLKDAGISGEETGQLVSLLMKTDEIRYGGASAGADLAGLLEETSKVIRSTTGRRAR